MKRKDPTLRQIAAAAVAQILDIPREHLKEMTTEQVLSLVHIDHDPVPVAVAVSIGWTPEQYNHPSNLSIRAILDHREKTAKRDIPAIAKSDRVEEAHAAFRQKVLAKTDGSVEQPAEKRRAKIPSRPFSTAKRPLNRRQTT